MGVLRKANYLCILSALSADRQAIGRSVAMIFYGMYNHFILINSNRFLDFQISFWSEKKNCIQRGFVFFFFNLPVISLRVGIINPSLASAYTTIGFSTFLNSNAPKQTDLNLGIFLILSWISSEKRMLVPGAMDWIRDARFTPSPNIFPSFWLKLSILPLNKG